MKTVFTVFKNIHNKIKYFIERRGGSSLRYRLLCCGQLLILANAPRLTNYKSKVCNIVKKIKNFCD